MDATIDGVETAPTSKEYTSRPGALVWFFKKSRDRWKSKYQELKASIKGYKNRVADLTKSREQWKLKAEEAAEQLSTLKTEVAALRAEAAARAEEKKRTKVSPR
jgi:peptidoglycan hydrolase CwlO-like protein